MKISELFYSIQGEGKRIGVPSFFVRTNICNLRCMFSSGNLCDTPYTSWSSNDSINIGEMSIKDIIFKFRKYGVKDVVITGGEPTMQSEDLAELCKILHEEGAYITLETNGTGSGDFLDNINLLSVSPKLSSSIPFNTKFEEMHSKGRINIEVLKEFHKFSGKPEKDIQWKFVYCEKRDLEEIRNLQKEIGFKNNDIYLMSEGITEKEIIHRREELVEICKQSGYNYTERLQILIWGNKRGV